MGFGWLAFAGLASRWAAAATPTVGPHFAPKAKHVIFLFMDGGVSHVDTFDPKPELAKHNGKAVEWKSTSGSQGTGPGRKWLDSPWPFKQRGQSGLWVSELLPHIAEVADELCVVRSVVGESPLHGAKTCCCTRAAASARRPAWGPGFPTGWGPRTSNCPATCC